MTFYLAGPDHPIKPSFPAEYRGGIFAAEHGSWNRKRRTGYEVAFVPLKNGKPTLEPPTED